MNSALAGAIGAILSLIGIFGYQVTHAPSFQGGTGTISQLDQWRATAGRVELASSTAGVRIPSLASLDCIGTNGDGDLGEGTCTGGGTGFSTTSANHWASLGLAFSTTSSDYWKSVNNFFSTTSASYFSALGLAFSTTSADYWETQQAPRGSSYSTSTATYNIYRSGSVVYSIDGDTGATVSSNSDLGVVLRATLAYATSTKGVDGGRINIKPGQYTSTGTTTIYGSGANYNPTWIIQGAGASTTDITQNGGDFLHFTNWAEVQVRDLSINLSGSENGFSALGTTANVRSVWNSHFEDIKLYSSAANHTGYAFLFGNDFRNQYENIELFGVGHGFRTYTQGSAFNNGDSVFERWFCELNIATASECFDLDGTAGGDVNQSTFIDVNGIADGGGAHTFVKMTNAFHNTFIGVNAEQFATTTDVISGRNNTFEFEYVTPSATGNYFGFGANAFNNSIGCRYLDNPSGAHRILLDASNLRGQHNILQGVGGGNCVIQGSGTYSFSTTSASIVREMHDNVSGVGSAQHLDELKVLGDRIVFNFQAAATTFWRYVSTGLELVVGGNTFATFTSTIATLTQTWDFSGATVKQHVYPSWTWPGTATTTTATTTVPIGSAYVAESWSGSHCRVTSGASGYRYGDGTNFMNYGALTTSEASLTLNSNNTFTALERRVVEVGPLTNAQITCTVDKVVNN